LYPAVDVCGFYDVDVCPSKTMDQMCEIRMVTYIYRLQRNDRTSYDKRWLHKI